MAKKDWQGSSSPDSSLGALHLGPQGPKQQEHITYININNKHKTTDNITTFLFQNTEESYLEQGSQPLKPMTALSEIGYAAPFVNLP